MSIQNQPLFKGIIRVRGMLGGTGRFLIRFAPGQFVGAASEKSIARQVLVMCIVMLCGAVMRFRPGIITEGALVVSSFAPFIVSCMIMRGTITLNKGE